MSQFAKTQSSMRCQMTIIREGSLFKPAVHSAITELDHYFPGRIEARELSDGGAAVTVRELSLNGGPYRQADTWCGFTISFAHPYADIYPHFVRPDLARNDNQPFGQGFHAGRDFYGVPALMLSRRVRLSSSEFSVNPIIKLEKVMAWLLTR